MSQSPPDAAITYFGDVSVPKNVDTTGLVSPLIYDKESLSHIVNSQDGVWRIQTLTSLMRLVSISGYVSYPKVAMIRGSLEEVFQKEIMRGDASYVYNLLTEAESLEGARMLGDYLARTEELSLVTDLIDSVVADEYMVQFSRGFFDNYFAAPERGTAHEWVRWIESDHLDPMLKYGAIRSLFLGYSKQGYLHDAQQAAVVLDPSSRERQVLDGLLISDAARIDPSFGLEYIRKNPDLQNLPALYRNLFRTLQREDKSAFRTYLERLTDDEILFIEDIVR